MNVHKHVRRPLVLILMTALLLMNLSACGGNAEESGADSETAWRENAGVKVFGVDLTQDASAVQLPIQVICGQRSAWAITTIRGDFIYQFDHNADALTGNPAAQIEWQQADTEYLVNITERNGTLYAEIRDTEKNIIEIRKRAGSSWSTVMSLEDREETWIYVGTGFFVDSNENAYLVNEDTVTRFDTAGKQVCRYELGGSIWTFKENDDGYVDCVVTDSKGITLYELKENAADVKWTLAVSANQVYGIQTGQESRLCLAAGGELLFLDQNTGEVLEIADLAGIGISFFQAGYYDAGADALWLYGESRDDSRCLFCSKLSGRDGSSVAQRTELIYAARGTLDSRIEASIMAFNQSNENYYITVKYYNSNSGEEWNAGEQRLNMELASGNGPDIIQMYFWSYDPYVENGYLVDLRPYLEQSEYADDLLWNVLDTYDRNGGLYQFVPHFGLYGVTVHPEYIDSVGEWNIAALLDLMERDQWEKDIAYCKGNIDWLWSKLFVGAQKDFADWEQKKAFFEGEEFIRLLTLCKEYSEQTWPDMDYVEAEYLVEQMGFDEYRYSIPWIIVRYGNAYPVYGYPTSSGQIYRIDTSLDNCAINANSANIEGAWEYIESLLTDSYQDMHGMVNSGLPIRDSAIQRSAAEVLGEKNTMNHIPYEITEADIKIIDDIIRNGEFFTIEDRDYQIQDIILEEAGAYFTGGKSAEEVAHIIQNKVQLMLDEY